jgi:DNA repair protein RecO (recombination protein O)
MSYIKTKAIVIREVNIGEADKLLTLLTKEHGLMTVVARNARRSRSKLAAASQLLCYSEYVIFKNKESYTINSSDIIDSFYSIRNDLTRLTYTAHIISMVCDVAQEGQPSPRLLQLLLNTIYIFSKDEKNPELAARVFELRMLSILGYAPQLKHCDVCGKTDSPVMYFSFSKCSLLCSSLECIGNDGSAIVISQGAVKAMRHIIYSKASDIFKFDLAANVLLELGAIVNKYLRERLEKDYKKLEFLKHFQAIDTYSNS